MLKQNWTSVVLAALAQRSYTTAQLRALPQLAAMHAQHLQERAKHTTLANFINPVNSMVYDTLYRLRRQGKVVRGEDGVYHLVK